MGVLAALSGAIHYLRCKDGFALDIASRWRSRVCILIVSSYTLVATHVSAQNESLDPTYLQSSQEVKGVSTGDEKSDEALDLSGVPDELALLRKRLEFLEKNAVQKESSSKQEATSPKQKNGWTTNLGGHIQTEYVTWANKDDALDFATNYFNFRRLRLVANGTGYEQFDFRLQLTLEPNQPASGDIFTSPDVKDAYVSMNEIPGIGRFRIGNFFVPFSLEQVTNDTNNIFVERSIPTQGIFAADREVGMAIYNSALDDRVTWTTGIFFDDITDGIKTRINANQGYRLSGRLTCLPIYEDREEGTRLMHAGVGILHTGDFDKQVRFRSRPSVQRGPFLIDSGILDADTYTTGNLEFATILGSLTSQTELFVSQVNLNTGRTAHVGGAYTHLSYFVTGEHRMFDPFGQHGAQFSRNVPFRNFSTKKGVEGWGALELKVRWAMLDLSEVSAGQYNDFTAGFNWYWSDRTRIMFDWIHPFTSSQTVFGQTEADLLAMRFDVNW